MPISFDSIANSLGRTVTASAARLDTSFSAADPNTPLSSQQLLEMQTNLTKWTLAVNLQSTVTKELGDTLKGIIQKSG